MNLTLTPVAEKFIRRPLGFGGGSGSGLRLTARPGGCSGLAAAFSVEAAPDREEAAVAFAGVSLFLNAKSRLLLTGVTIDFSETPLSTGFVFHDLKTINICGGDALQIPTSAS